MLLDVMIWGDGLARLVQCVCNPWSHREPPAFYNRMKPSYHF